MKNLSLFVSAFALCASTSYAAIDCSTLPSCDSLGYKDKVADCPSSSEVLKCPFDTAWGKCTRGPSVGDLKYSLLSNDHDGWLKCDGRMFSSDSTGKYYKLFQLIGTNFCHKYTSKDDSNYATSNCSSGMFAVPDYRGFFLRGMPAQRLSNATGVTATQKYYGDAAGFMTGNMENYTIYTPKKEQLPNIKGNGGWYENTSRIKAGEEAMKNRVNGAFYLSEAEGNFGAAEHDSDNHLLNFNASLSNAIYTDSGHVIPAHYAANIFIYAGK